MAVDGRAALLSSSIDFKVAYPELPSVLYIVHLSLSAEDKSGRNLSQHFKLCEEKHPGRFPGVRKEVRA